MVHVKVPEPEFEGQTKTKLGNPEVRRIVDDVVHQKLLEVFEWNPKVGGVAYLGFCVTPRQISGDIKMTLYHTDSTCNSPESC